MPVGITIKNPRRRYLIEEHRKCIAELKRLKLMIANLAKYIGTLHEKGTYILNNYMGLKHRLDELRQVMDGLKRDGARTKVSYSFFFLYLTSIHKLCVNIATACTRRYNNVSICFASTLVFLAFCPPSSSFFLFSPSAQLFGQGFLGQESS